MQMSLEQRKLALLHDRLLELLATGDRSPSTGCMVRSGEGHGGMIEVVHPDDSWGETRGRIALEEIAKYRTDVTPQHRTLTGIDQFTTALFKFAGDAAILADPPDLYAFASVIGIGRERARYIIDYTHAGRLPTFSAVTQARDETLRFVQKHGGLYTVYRYDDNKGTRKNPLGVLTRSTLSIRYPVPYRAHASDKTAGDCRIRCRLVIPAYTLHANGQPYKYDGYVGIKDRNWMQFLFQARRQKERNRKSEDIILMYTEQLTGLDGTPAHSMGVQLTQNQELVPAVSTVVLVRHPGCTVTEHNFDPQPEYLLPPFTLPDDAETDFTNKTVKALDLARIDSEEWSATDRQALALLTRGWSRLNLRGLR